MIKALFLGDIVGAPGRTAVIQTLPLLKKELGINFVVVNGENAAGGRGITLKIAQDLLKAGADVVTMGDHVWDQGELASLFHQEPRLLRPLNYQAGTPGKGSVVCDTAMGKIAVMQLQGRSFIQPPLENPFTLGEQEAIRLREEEGACAILVDMHAETTSEKIALGYHLDGKVSAIFGTHTHVQTADEIIHEGGTAYITDAGMCGPALSILGREREGIIKRFVTTLPQKFPVATWPVRLSGAIVEIDPSTGHALSIERFTRIIEKPI